MKTVLLTLAWLTIITSGIVHDVIASETQDAIEQATEPQVCQWFGPYQYCY